MGANKRMGIWVVRRVDVLADCKYILTYMSLCAFMDETNNSKPLDGKLQEFWTLVRVLEIGNTELMRAKKIFVV